MSETNKPLFLEFFKKDFVFSTKMIDVPASFAFTSLNAGSLNFTTDINIHGSGYLSKKNIKPQEVSVEIAVATSSFFTPFNQRGALVAALKITFSEKEPMAFERRADIRVDDGRFIVCDLDYVSHIAELQTKMSLPSEKEDYEDEDIYDLLVQGKVSGSNFSTGILTRHSQELVVDEKKAIEVNAGYGDGTYPLWFGYDADGNISAVYVDFKLFDRHDVIEQIINKDKKRNG